MTIHVLGKLKLSNLSYGLSISSLCENAEFSFEKNPSFHLHDNLNFVMKPYWGTSQTVRWRLFKFVSYSSFLIRQNIFYVISLCVAEFRLNIGRGHVAMVLVWIKPHQ